MKQVLKVLTISIGLSLIINGCHVSPDAPLLSPVVESGNSESFSLNNQNIDNSENEFNLIEESKTIIEKESNKSFSKSYINEEISNSYLDKINNVSKRKNNLIQKYKKFRERKPQKRNNFLDLPIE